MAPGMPMLRVSQDSQGGSLMYMEYHRLIFCVMSLDTAVFFWKAVSIDASVVVAPFSFPRKPFSHSNAMLHPRLQDPAHDRHGEISHLVHAVVVFFDDGILAGV